MPAHRISWSWSPSAQDKRAEAARNLKDRLRESALDRAANSRAVTLEAASLLQHWLAERPKGWGREPAGVREAGAELEAGWGEWVENHGWRGTCAGFIDALRKTFHSASEVGAARQAKAGSMRAALRGELEAWLEPELRTSHDGQGTASAPGPRWIDPQRVVPHALRTLRRAEALLIHGYSETVLASLAAAQKAGLFPQVLVGLGLADQSGTRMARQLSAHGIHVRLLWDAAALGSVPSVDRIWLGTEAVGSGGFCALVGTTLLLAEANRNEVPVSVLCTSDKLLPGGELQLPRWGSEERWNLWSHGPDEVEVESQPFELVAAGADETWITEEGPESLVAFCTRSRRTGTAAPCSIEPAS